MKLLLSSASLPGIRVLTFVKATNCLLLVLSAFSFSTTLTAAFLHLQQQVLVLVKERDVNDQ